MSPRERVQDAGRENVLVPLALGAISCLGSLERALLAPAARPAQPARGRADDAPPLADDDPLLLAALGALALRRSLLAALVTGDACVATDDDQSTAAGRPPHDLGRLAR
jgi:hypothetical protein